MNCLATAAVKPAMVDLAAAHDILVVPLKVNHTMNEALLLGLLPAARFEHEMRSWYACVALSNNRALPFR